jgi:predicted enzyme related to lactoylglutathione lyase
MDGKMTFIYLPVADMAAARTFYRDQLGLQEAWRQGDASCAFGLPGTDVQLMLTATSVSPQTRAGMVFHVADVESFYQENQGQIDFQGQPYPIPGVGRWVGALDASGNGIYFADAAQ